MSGVGLVGTSGVGKTTLAEKVSDMTGVPYISSQVRPVYDLFGVDLTKNLSFEEKMPVQRKILEVAESDYASVGGIFITDRTPIDFAAYVMVDALNQGMTESQTEEVFDYMEQCYRLANLYFQSLILIQPAIAFVNRAARPSNRAYLEHLNLIMLGIIADPDAKIHCAKNLLKKSITDLDKRAEVVIKIASLVESNNMKQRNAALHIH